MSLIEIPRGIWKSSGWNGGERRIAENQRSKTGSSTAPPRFHRGNHHPNAVETESIFAHGVSFFELDNRLATLA